MSSDIFEFNSTLSEMDSLLETWDESDDENDEIDDEDDENDENHEIFTIRRERRFMRKLCMTVVKQASYDPICKRDHHQFWSYWEVESTSDICKLRSRDCIIKAIHYALRNLKKDCDDLWFPDEDESEDESLELLLRMVVKMKVLSEELVEACTSAVRISFQRKTSRTTHLVLQLFGHLTQSLWNIMNCKSNLLVPEEAQMKIDEEKLRIVGVLICFVHRQSVEQKEYILSQFGPTADYIASLSYLHLIMEMDRNLKYYISKRLTDLLQNIDLDDRKHLLGFVDLLLENLRQLSNSNGQVGLLNREVKMLLKFFANMHEEDFQKKKLPDHLVQIEDATCKLISIFCSLFYVKDITEQVHINLPKFVQEVNVIKEEYKNIYPKSTRRIFSNMDGPVFIDFFLDDLKELSVNNKRSISLVKLEVETIQKNLEWFRSFLKATIQLNHEHEVLKDLILRCINVACEAESMIDTFVIDDTPSWDNMLSLADVMEEIEHIKIEVAEIYDSNSRKIIDANIIDAKKTSCVMSTIPTNSDVRGFSLQNEAVELSKGVEQKIKYLLLSDSQKLDVISIYGMPGLGKTTLAHRVFSGEDINRRFPNFRIFCRVSEVYNKRGLLLDMLRQLNKIPDKDDGKSADDLANDLRKRLFGQRYLIVLDDVWSTEAWDDLQRAFPKQEQGSRVILTTREKNVALHAKIESEPVELPFLTDDESWQLLKQKVFKDDSCPDELLEVGKRIAKNCQGLPLTIVLIAGVIQEEQKSPFWSKVADSFTSQSKSLLGHCNNTINLSFMHLPEHLKPCFLYIAAFPEDQEIQIRKLKRLWMAERFIPLTKETSLENVAQNYLMDLTSRSLVIVGQKSFTKGVKSIFIHDLIRQFCIAKSEEENFLRILQRDDSSSQTSPDSYLSRLSIQYGEPKTRDVLDNLRSFLLFYDDESSSDIMSSYAPKNLTVLEYLKHLRVLDLGVVIDEMTLGAICLLIHLRYLAFRTKENIGPSIANLGKLQTLIVKTAAYGVRVCDRLWELKCLRHIHCDQGVYVEFGESFRNCAEFGNVESFSTDFLGLEVEDIIRKMPNLRKLGFSFWRSCDDSSESCKECPKLSDFGHLRKLESLNVIGNCPKFLFSCEFNLPLNLKKLTLSNFEIPWSQMSIIANLLPNLEVLKLLRNAFSGKTWDMEDEIFAELKFLELNYLDLKEWSVSHEAFPKLQHLTFLACLSLEQIPSDFEQSCTLQTIQMDWCQQSLGHSALELKEEIADSGINDNLQVIISNAQKF